MLTAECLDLTTNEQTNKLVQMPMNWRAGNRQLRSHSVIYYWLPWETPNFRVAIWTLQSLGLSSEEPSSPKHNKQTPKGCHCLFALHPFNPHWKQPVAWVAPNVWNYPRRRNAHALISLHTDRGVVYILISSRDECNRRSFEWWTVRNSHAHRRHAWTQGDGYNTPMSGWGLTHH